MGRLNTPLPVRDTKFLMDWSYLRSPIPVFGGPCLRFPGTRMDKVARRDYGVLMKFQNGAFISNSEFSSCGAFDEQPWIWHRNNFHGTRSVYLLPHVLPHLFDPSSPSRTTWLLPSKLPIRVTRYHLVSACLSSGSTLHRVHIDELPRGQNRCGKQNGELFFLRSLKSPQFGFVDLSRVETGLESPSCSPNRGMRAFGIACARNS